MKSYTHCGQRRIESKIREFDVLNRPCNVLASCEIPQRYLSAWPAFHGGLATKFVQNFGVDSLAPKKERRICRQNLSVETIALKSLQSPMG